MTPDSATFPLAARRDDVVGRLASWLGFENPTTSRRSAWAIGLLGAAVAVALGSALYSHAGGGEPLMAVFPILLITCLRAGALAGGITLAGGLVGAWYIYLGEPFSFIVRSAEARAVVTALAVGLLIIMVCALLRASQAGLRVANAASLSLATGLAERTAQLDEMNATLTRSLQDRNAARDAVALSEAQFRASFEAAAVGKVHSDPANGRILRSNAAFATMLGYTPEELAGRIGWDFTVEDDRPGDQAAYQAVLEGRHPVYIREKRYLRRDGTHVWGRVSSTITRAPETGEPVLAISVVENIDQRHKATLELEAANLRLGTLLEERTVTLAQRDLLLREVYHRVKNNLQVIDSMLSLQANRLSDPVAKAALAGMRSRVYALGLVHHQLMGSPDLQTFEVAPFLEELSTNLIDGGAHRGVKLSVRADPLKVGLDFAIPLGLIVTELVTNSLKHAFPDGSGAIEVALETTAGGAVTLLVSDNGVGSIDPGGRPGSLGMTIVKSLVRQLGGAMTVNTNRGHQTQIILESPKLHAPA